MTFGREMHHEIEVVTAKQGLNQPGVAYIAVHELELSVFLHGVEIGPVARIGERVEHDDRVVWMQPTPVQNEIGTDETRAAGNQKLCHCAAQPRFAVSSSATVS